MSRTKSLIQMINACEKHEFDKVVKAYLKDVFGYERIVLTDGKDDMGLDLKVFDFSGQKLQFQMTVQKSDTPQHKSQLKEKINEDIAKAHRNVAEYGFSNILYFFYSYELTNKFIQECEILALQNAVTLHIIDAKRIAEESDSYINLQRVIYSTSQFSDFKLKDSFYDEKQNLIYDLVSFGETSDVKKDIVEKYIIRLLYDNKSLTQIEIEDLCASNFSSKENPTFYSKLINKLYCIDRLITYSKETKRYSLSAKEIENVSNKLEQMRNDESVFMSQVGCVLKEYDQDALLENYVGLLYDLYIRTFSQRIKLYDEIDNFQLATILSFAETHMEDSKYAKEMVRKLFMICDENKYLQKICAGKVFSSQISIDDLQRYAQERKRVFIDTNVALFLLCYFYNTSLDYDHNQYLMSKYLSEYCRKNKIKLYLTNRYLREVETHLQEAFNLVPFTKLAGFSVLGRSRNVFYNFYCYLNESDICESTFEEFLAEYKFYNSNITETNLQLIEMYLSDVGVEVIDIPKHYDIQQSSKLIGNKLSELNRTKTSFALKNDSIMLEFLGDPDVDVHIVDPVFITWDKTLYSILKDFFNMNPSAHRWMQFSPGQYVDRCSLLSFNINQETMSKEIVALLSEKIVSHTYSLIDCLSLILNPNNEVGLEYTKRFASMKDNKIYDLGKVVDEPKETLNSDVVDKLVFVIVSAYRDDTIRFESLKKLFLSEDKIDAVMSIINENLDAYMLSGSFKEDIISRFDDLILEL